MASNVQLGERVSISSFLLEIHRSSGLLPGTSVLNVPKIARLSAMKILFSFLRTIGSISWPIYGTITFTLKNYWLSLGTYLRNYCFHSLYLSTQSLFSFLRTIGLISVPISNAPLVVLYVTLQTGLLILPITHSIYLKCAPRATLGFVSFARRLPDRGEIQTQVIRTDYCWSVGLSHSLAKRREQLKSTFIKLYHLPLMSKLGHLQSHLALRILVKTLLSPT